MSSFLKDLNMLQETFEEGLIDLGDRIFQQLIIPKCQQHHMAFYSANGVSYFIKNGKNIHYFDTDKVKKYGLRTIFHLLNKEIYPNKHLGDYIDGSIFNSHLITDEVYY